MSVLKKSLEHWVIIVKILSCVHYLLAAFVAASLALIVTLALIHAYNVHKEKKALRKAIEEYVEKWH